MARTKRARSPVPAMRITYDPAVDALAVELAPNARSARMVRITDDTRYDLDADGRLIAIEILNARAYYPAAQLAQLGSAVEWLSLAVAAQESGMAIGALSAEIRRGSLAGEKRGRRWVVAQHELWNYLERLDKPPSTREPRYPSDR